MCDRVDIAGWSCGNLTASANLCKGCGNSPTFIPHAMMVVRGVSS